MLRPGDPWGEPCNRTPDLSITASDAELAEALGRREDPILVDWTPRGDTDLGRAIGRAPGTAPTTGWAGPMDLLHTDRGIAVNAVVWGSVPGRLRWTSPARDVRVTVDDREIWRAPAASVVIANGEFVAGDPIAPKAHPGDGVLDVVILAPSRGERRGFRARLAVGEHLPHPSIRTARGRRVSIVSPVPVPLLLDGVPGPPTRELRAHLESDRWFVLL